MRCFIWNFSKNIVVYIPILVIIGGYFLDEEHKSNAMYTICLLLLGIIVPDNYKDTITVDILHADNKIHSLPDQVCKGIKTFVTTVCHKDGLNRVRVTINHCVKCRAFMKFLFPLHKEIAVGLIGDIRQCIDMNCIVTFLPSWMKVLSAAGLCEMLTSESSQAKSP